MEVWPGRLPPAPADLHAACSDAEGLLCLLTDRIDAALLAAAPVLRAVSVMAVGVDNVDLAACSARGIQVGHTPGVLTDTTADLAFGLLIAAARRIAEGERDARAGRYEVWDPGGYLGEEVHGATLGIVGMGRIGSAVARRGEGFGMEVIHTGELPLDELLGRADFVSLHVPLRDDTRGLIGERELRLMKPTALLVNTSRGEVVETDALVRALREGWIAAAALDVTDPEPLPAGHPLLDLALVTPHIGSASRRTRELMASMAVDNLLAGLRGERMPHLANP
ncbi:MAG: glyoxylate reductase [Thermoleophilaceae bacterium]|nr:glyoxylate reductase [Thermoleophilaceae bacterium]